MVDYFTTRLKVHSHGAICSACDNSFIHAFLWYCSHSAMGLDAICNVCTLESHIAITQNRHGTHSCVTLHTSMHHMQSKSHCVNSVINNHTIQFLYLKNCSRTSHRVNERLYLLRLLSWSIHTKWCECESIVANCQVSNVVGGSENRLRGCLQLFCSNFWYVVGTNQW